MDMLYKEYTKRFDDWNERQKTTDASTTKVFPHSREIWWCALGVNIGSEQDGKNESFERPVLIIRSMQKDLVLIAPTTSKIEKYADRIDVIIAGKPVQILLSQLRTVSTRRLPRNAGAIRIQLFQEILIRIAHMVLSREVETPPFGGESRNP